MPRFATSGGAGAVSGVVGLGVELAALTAGGLGLLLSQAALQKSRLSSSMPAQDLLALLVSIALGATLLGEVPHLTGSLLVGTVIALTVTGHGIVQLSKALPHATTSPRLDDGISHSEMTGSVRDHPTMTPDPVQEPSQTAMADFAGQGLIP